MNKKVITDAERYNFICDCEDENALNILSEMLGNRARLTKMVDDLINEQGETT
jgi:CheY-specific phosphatase CheX